MKSLDAVNMHVFCSLRDRVVIGHNIIIKNWRRCSGLCLQEEGGDCAVIIFALNKASVEQLMIMIGYGKPLAASGGLIFGYDIGISG